MSNLDFLESENVSSVDTILQIDEDIPAASHPDNIVDELEEDPAENITQHNFVTSPWTRFAVVGLVFGLGFFVVFLFFSGIFNSNSHAENDQPSSLPEETLSRLEKNDGDVYAQAALGRQENELRRINNQPVKEEDDISNTFPEPTPEPSPSPKPPPPAPVRTYSPPPTPVRSYTPPTPARTVSAMAVTPARTLPPPPAVAQSILDPIAELNRLRRVGSFGNIDYGNIAYADNSPPPSTPVFDSPPPDNTPENSQPFYSNPSDRSGDGIDRMQPRWHVEPKSQQNLADIKVASVGYLPQEAQILNERRQRFLVVGEYASGTLLTPLIKKEETDKNKIQEQTDDGKRYVARLTEDLRDNYGEIAIPSGTLLNLAILSVDESHYTQVEVISIIKDNTEYPINQGTITVQGDGGRPLIAKKFHDKGGEIARSDLTVGLVSGLGKIGEIINQPDIQDDIEDELWDGRIRRRTRTDNSRRSIAGAALEGVFGSLSETMSRRAEIATQEALLRPNVWYIPANTKITFIVNRSLELP
ncbi:TrbI/VirB10 family protein [Nostoc sp. CCY0012]|uniref:TrbI/VirB10 family protein n=1 Tax=Nostoc sp. CCY0012 TaxID=1056123 RepID=UPI0039C6C98D